MTCDSHACRAIVPFAMLGSDVNWGVLRSVAVAVC